MKQRLKSRDTEKRGHLFETVTLRWTFSLYKMSQQIFSQEGHVKQKRMIHCFYMSVMWFLSEIVSFWFRTMRYTKQIRIHLYILYCLPVYSTLKEIADSLHSNDYKLLKIIEHFWQEWIGVHVLCNINVPELPRC